MIVGMGFGTGFVRVYGVQCRCPLKQAFNLESTNCSLPWNVGVSVSFLPDFLRFWELWPQGSTPYVRMKPQT